MKAYKYVEDGVIGILIPDKMFFTLDSKSPKYKEKREDIKYIDFSTLDLSQYQEIDLDSDFIGRIEDFTKSSIEYENKRNKLEETYKNEINALNKEYDKILTEKTDNVREKVLKILN